MREGVCICAYMLEQETKRKEAEMVYKYNRTKVRKMEVIVLIFYGTGGEKKLKDV